MSSNYIDLPSYGNAHWKGPVDSAVDLPANGNNIGDVRLTEDTNTIYVWNGTAWIAVATPGAAIAIDGLIGDVSATGPGTVVATVNFVGGQSAASVAAATVLVETPHSGNLVLASPANGNSGVATFRNLVGADFSGAFTTGSVIFAGSSGELAQDNAKFFWDDTTARLFMGANASIAGSNAGIQYSDATTANRGQIKLHSYFNGTSIAGVSTLTSRSGTVGVNAAVVAGQDYSKWTAQAGATTPGSAPISGTFAFKANSVNSLTVPSDFHIQLTNIAGTLGDRLYLSSEGLLQLPGYSTGILHSDSSGNITSSAISLTTDVTGVLPIANGGTNNAGPFTAGSVIFSNGTSLTQDNSQFFWDDSAMALGIGTAPAATAVLDIVNNSGSTKAVQATGYGSNVGFRARRANGTLGSPTASLTNDVLSFFSGRGYGDTGFAAASTGAINITANATFTDLSMPTSMNFNVTAVGSVTSFTALTILNTGSLQFGNNFTANITAGSGAAAGNQLTLIGGTGVTTNGGAVNLLGGVAAAAAGANGGAVNITSGAGSATGAGGNGGAVTITGNNANGDNTTNNSGGTVNINGGNSKGNTAGGAVNLSPGIGGAGTAGNAGNGGPISAQGGTGGVGATTSGNGGNVSLQGGTAGAGTTPGNGGSATVQGGSSAAVAGSAGGAITIQSGNGTTTGTGGAGGGITMNGGNAGGDDTVNRAAGGMTFNAGNSKGGSTGGSLTGNAGNGGAGTNAGDGGHVLYTGGNGGAGATTSGAGGAITMNSGPGGAGTNGGNGGAAALNAGNGGAGSSTGGTGGALTLTSGNGGATAGAGAGNINMTSGTGSSTGSGGNGGTVNITASNAGGNNTVNRNGGDVNISSGNSFGSAVGGAITLSSGNGGVGTATTGAVGGGLTLTAGVGGVGSATGGAGGVMLIQGGKGGNSGTPGAGGVIRFQTATTTAFATRGTVTAAGLWGFGNNTTPTYLVDVLGGNIGVATVGNGYRTKEGAGGKQGVSTLAAGTVTVANTNVTATSRIFLTSQVDGGTPGFVRVSTRTAGTSFTITSSSGTDTSTIAWEIFEPY